MTKARAITSVLNNSVSRLSINIAWVGTCSKVAEAADPNILYILAELDWHKMMHVCGLHASYRIKYNDRIARIIEHAGNW